MKFSTVIKIHLFFYWGSLTGIFKFSGLFAKKYLDATEGQIGLLFGVLPFFLIFSKPFFSVLADKYSIHKMLIVLFNSIMTISFIQIMLIIYYRVYFEEQKYILWYIFFSSMSIGLVCIGVSNSLIDSLIIKVAEIDDSNYGNIRAFGTMGWGSFGLIMGLSNNYFKMFSLYVPSLMIFSIFSTLDVTFFTYYLYFFKMKKEQKFSNETALNENKSKKTPDVHLQKKSASSSQIRPKLEIIKYVVQTLVEYPLILKYMVIFSFIGALTSLHHHFFSLFLNELIDKDTSKFIGYITLVECFCSEIPFFFLSNSIVKKIGVKISLCLVLFSFSVRYFSYTLLDKSTIYYVFFIEINQGMTYGLFNFVMNFFAKEYGEKMLLIYQKSIAEQNATKVTSLNKNQFTNEEHSKSNIGNVDENNLFLTTMQSLFSASYEGFGIGLGSCIGGYLIQHKGFKFIWYFFSSLSFIIFLIECFLYSYYKFRSKSFKF